MSDRQFTVFFILSRIAVQILRGGQISSKTPPAALRMAGHDRVVLAFRFSLGKLGLHRIRHFFCLAEHQQTRNASIQPMHQKRATTRPS